MRRVFSILLLVPAVWAAALAVGTDRAAAVGEVWTQQDPPGAPPGRAGHSAVNTGTAMVVFGGIGEGQLFDDLWSLDAGATTWTELTPSGGPEARFGHTAVWAGSRMLVFGGLAPDASELLVNDLWAWDPAPAPNGTWTELTPANPPAGRAFHTAVWTGSVMLVFGGGGVDASFNDLWQWDPAPAPNGTWTQLTPARTAPSIRNGHSAVWTGTAMLVFGGFANDTEFENDLWEWDPDPAPGGTWTELTPSGTPPEPRAGHGAAFQDSKMFVFAGESDSGLLNDMWSYDPAAAANAWVEVEPEGGPPLERVLPTLVAEGATELRAFGGLNETECPDEDDNVTTFLNDTWSLFLTGGTEESPAQTGPPCPTPSPTPTLTPTPTPTPVPVSLNTSSIGSITPATPRAGSTATISGGGFLPNTFNLPATFDSAALTTVTADAAGRFSKAITIPTNATVGPHTIRVVGANSQRGVLTVTINFSTAAAAAAPTLPRTGASVLILIVVGVALVACGLLLIAARRKPSIWKLTAVAALCSLVIGAVLTMDRDTRSPSETTRQAQGVVWPGVTAPAPAAVQERWQTECRLEDCSEPATGDARLTTSPPPTTSRPATSRVSEPAREGDRSEPWIVRLRKLS